MNRVTSSATLFLAAIMLAVGTAVAFPTANIVISHPSDITQSDMAEVEISPAPAVSETVEASESGNLLAAAAANENSAPAVPLIAAPVSKAAKSQSLYWAMKFVLGNANVGVDQLPPIGDGSVKLIRKGTVVGTYSIGPGGVAQVPQLSSGVYSIVARSVDGFAAIGSYLVSGTEEGELTVKLALVPVQESAVIDSLLARAKESRSTPAGARKEYRYNENTSLVSMNDVVGRGADGVVRVRLLELLDQYGVAQTTEGLSVHLVRNEQIASHGITNADGIAELQGAENGRYAMVVTGQSRVLVISILVKDQIGNINNEIKSAISLITNIVIGSAPAAMNQAVSVAAAGTTPPEDFNTVNQSMNVGSGGPGAPGGVGGAPFGGGPGGGGTGGGGGGSGAGGGGVGGGGGLLGAAAAGAAGFLAGNNNNDNGVASP